MTNIKAIIRARMGSTRLPGKVLEIVCGKPLLLWQIERIQKCKLVDDIIVATSNNPVDDELINFCKVNNINFFRGPENDVLNRVSQTIKKYNINLCAEFCGDSPLPDYKIIDMYLSEFLEKINHYDFLTNALQTSYPPGMDVVVYKSEILLDSDKRIPSDDPLREHCS